MDHAKRVTDNRVRPTREKADTLRGPTSNKNSRANLIIVIIIIMVCDNRNTISYLPTERGGEPKNFFYCFRRDVVVGRTTWKCCLCPSSVGARRPPGEEEEKKVTWRFRHFWCGALPDCHYSSISSYTIPVEFISIRGRERERERERDSSESRSNKKKKNPTTINANQNGQQQWQLAQWRWKHHQWST